MENIAQKIIATFVSLLFFLGLSSEQFVNLKITTSSKLVGANVFRCELDISPPKGWKLLKVPDISILASKDLKDFKYDKNFEQLDETTYRVSFTVAAEKTSGNQLELTVDCFICKDICTIVSKNIKITLNNEQKSPRIWILLLGFLGGLILNFMPCILPVIIMKLKAITSKKAICGTIAGNYVTFTAFAAFIAFFKIIGEEIGWGMHFQNPYFLEAMTFILFFLALYSLGIIAWFPSVIIRENRAFYGNFLSSIVASIIAIPCTAPFLGTAATFAIHGSVADLFSVFFAIATGFSSPYFFATLIPAQIFVKFQRFENFFKRFVDCGVLITFLWVFGLLSNYFSSETIILYALSFIGAAYLIKKQKLLLAGVILGTCCCLGHYEDFATKTADSIQFNEDVIALLSPESVKKQVTIFNITANWCLACKYNHRVFSNKKIIELMKNNNVKFIEADMTKKNNSLMKFINGHGRVGIPFTIVYGPHAQDGILLDEILLESALIEAIERAK
ncbi:MAG: thioredoxin family protein [Holosporaceae bacterium]|jgi:thiol:disulfide interchange protein|nr:thioredoxin family protein [Holosporaceae bacterium]